MEHAVFIRKGTAERVAKHMEELEHVRAATVQRHYHRRAMQGYRVGVKYADGVRSHVTEEQMEMV